ncbi:hypothetical protein C4K18_5016 [Pseudomonas chlororaphis subsp. aurantiaca]|nr:hypothetical protein C4K18_5016 [Pseudomonas chlororaphis subsp. aurantiaca]
MRGRGSRHRGGLNVADSHEEFPYSRWMRSCRGGQCAIFGAPRLSP